MISCLDKWITSHVDFILPHLCWVCSRQLLTFAWCMRHDHETVLLCIYPVDSFRRSIGRAGRNSVNRRRLASQLQVFQRYSQLLLQGADRPLRCPIGMLLGLWIRLSRLHSHLVSNPVFPRYVDPTGPLSSSYPTRHGFLLWTVLRNVRTLPLQDTSQKRQLRTERISVCLLNIIILKPDFSFRF